MTKKKTFFFLPFLVVFVVAQGTVFFCNGASHGSCSSSVADEPVDLMRV